MKYDKNKYEYVVNQIIDLCKDNKIKNIALTSTFKETTLNLIINELKKVSINENIELNFDNTVDKNINLIKAVDPENNYESLKTIKESDGVVLFEKLTTTTHKKFD
ncbi:MAG: hypothetical protein RR483_04685, partial [Clostridia bacterium]